MYKLKNHITHIISLIAIIILFLSIHQCYAQNSNSNNIVKSEYSYRRYTLADGLSDMKLRTIKLDSRGFLWLGMLDGFARFDGMNFDFYHPEIQACSFGIMEDAEGKMIFKGSRYNHRLSESGDSIVSTKISDTLFYNMQNSRFVPFPYGIFENLAGDRKYLVKESHDSLILVNAPSEIYENKIDFGKVLLDIEEGLMFLPGDEVVIYEMKTDQKTVIQGLAAESFVKKSKDELTVLNQNGIYALNLNDFSYHNICKHEFDYNLIGLISDDSSLIISDFSNIYRFSNNQLELIADFSLINDIIFDFEGNLWVATNTGLYSFFRLNFKTYALGDSDVVLSIAEDAASNLYFGTLNGNLIKYNGTDFQYVDFPKFGYPIFSFNSGALSTKKSQYFPLPIGIMIKTGNRFKLADIPHGYPRRIHETFDGNLLFAMKNIGVYLCSPDGSVIANYSAEELGQNVTDAVFDEKGNRIVVTGSTGLNIIKEKSIRFIPNVNTSILHVSCPDRQGGIWVAGESQINLLMGDSLIAVHKFKNNSIKDLLLADNGWMLVATKLGLALFNPETYHSTGHFDFLWYDHGNGITGMDANTFGLFQQSNGMIWLLSSDCAISFPIDKLVTEVEKPMLHLMSLKTNDLDYYYHDESQLEPVVLPYSQNNLSISFIGLKYSAAHNIRYHYRLKGFNNGWVTNKTRSVDYNNLLPGKYAFEIFADAGTADSQTEMQTLGITIKPALWQTWWFQLVAVIMALSLSILTTYRILRRYYKKRTERLSLEANLNELKIKSIRLKSIPHFNANVLAAIEYYVMNMSKEEANRLLNVYASFTNRTLRDVENASRSLRDEIEYITLYLQLEKLRFRDKINYSIDIGENCDMEMQIPNMVLHTYCENAVKHGFSNIKQGFFIKIKALAHDNYVLITVEDNGIGRKAAEMQHKQHSSKQGLAILSRQIEIYNTFNEYKISQQIVDLYDAAGDAAGTRFELDVPVKFEYDVAAGTLRR